MDLDRVEVTPYITEADLQKKITEIATQINEKLKNWKEPALAICVLKGSFMFFSDLVRQINSDIKCDFLSCSSYGSSNKSSGEVKLTLDLASPIAGQNVIIIEDIVDTGLTMSFLVESIKARKPESITTVTLLDKKSARQNDFQPDIAGFEIPDEFVVGYGLDYNDYYRNLPYIATLRPQAIRRHAEKGA